MVLDHVFMNRSLTKKTLGSLKKIGDKFLTKKNSNSSIRTIIHSADKLRDQRNYSQAALLYRKAVSIAPWRTDLIVQMANMYKDSGLYEEAQQAYNEALLQTPKDPDIYLQLGRTLIMMGRKQAGIEMLHRATSIAPDFNEALYELGKNGDGKAFAHYHDGFTAHGGVAAVRSLSADILALQSSLATLATKLPDVETWSAVPVERYESFRKLFDVAPLPSRNKRNIRIRIISLADSLCVEHLYKQIQSIREQTYQEWEAVFCGRSNTARAAIQQLSVADKRIQWIEQPPNVTETGIERLAATGAQEWILLLATGTILHEKALEWFATAADQRSHSIFCCDAEVSDPSSSAEDISSKLIARWSFDPDIILQKNIWGDTLFVNAITNTRYAASVDAHDTLSGRRSALILEAGNVGHLPLILTEIPEYEDSQKRLEGHYSAVKRYLLDKKENIEISTPESMQKNKFSHLNFKRKTKKTDEHISVIICTFNNATDCKNFIDSLDSKASDRKNISYIIVDNGTSREVDNITLSQLNNKESIKVLKIPGPFNWSHLNNTASEMVDDGIIVFANDDMIMTSYHWDDIIRSSLQDPSIGVLGVKLIYPDQTIQHAGIMFGWNNSVIHDGLFRESSSLSQLARWQMERRVSAVTGAFMCMKKEKFQKIGGFDAQSFAVSYNDVNLCLMMRQAGYAIRWSPYITVIHYESKSRGADHLVPEKRARDTMERETIYQKWGIDIFSQDSTVNPVWYDATVPFSLLRPVTASAAFKYLEIQGDDSNALSFSKET